MALELDDCIAVFTWGIKKSVIKSRIGSSASLSSVDFEGKFKINREDQEDKCCGLNCLSRRNTGISPISTLAFSCDLPYSCCYTEYCPKVFRHLRCSFRIDEAIYISCLTSRAPSHDETCKGRSDSFFYRTFDGQLLIKEICRAEAQCLRKMLPSYHEYMIKAENESLLPQNLGLYKVCWSHGAIRRQKTKYFLVIAHLAPNSKLVFDLKGTLLHRQATPQQRNAKVCVLKDMDIIQSNAKIELGDEKTEKFAQLIKRDVEFLISHNIIDYSLLICFVTKSQSKQDGKSYAPTPSDCEDEPDRITPPEDSSNGGRFFVEYPNENKLSIQLYFGLIDTLTVFSSWNRAARCWKQIRYGRNVNTSSAPPVLYGIRFLEFLTKKVT